MKSLKDPDIRTDLDVILSAPGIRGIDVYRIFRAVFDELGLDLKELTVQRWGNTVERLEHKLERGSLKSFSLTQESTFLAFSAPEEGYHARISVRCGEGWYERMLEPVLKRTLALPRFVMAYGLNSRYWYEQNLDDAKERKKLGFVCEEEKVTCDGAPFPVTRWTYDLTGKPGLKREHAEYVEVPAARMWLSDRFWTATGARKADAQKAPWLKTRELDQGILYVEAWPELFNSDQGEQGVIQKKLRAVLFPQDASAEERVLLGSGAPTQS